MALKIFHTSDVHLGIKFEGYPEPPPPGAELAAQIAGKAATKPAPAKP